MQRLLNSLTRSAALLATLTAGAAQAACTVTFQSASAVPYSWITDSLTEYSLDIECPAEANLPALTVSLLKPAGAPRFLVMDNWNLRYGLFRDAGRQQPFTGPVAVQLDARGAARVPLFMLIERGQLVPAGRYSAVEIVTVEY
ncbi:MULTISPECIES: spore coat protein U domain-containing protein [unclassified Deinococcus]|uniref:spore coat protein U domain-containing protein n=1 Tax=unclassified Deinococcus TaxID=2623546 RepID=UPI001E3EEC77|nr:MULTISPECIES: spore coat protein U domain-containing protein [unclassified Deinococcus]MCD0157900.1 spore coat protein U domain-containing protein [Deinococcus sp. 6GRE01]MCD0161679.1 spore coat protein U domain-containing protein [Deinococcus sp. 6YEL10]